MYKINKLQHGKRFVRDFLQLNASFCGTKNISLDDVPKVHLFRITGKLLVKTFSNKRL